MAKKDDFDFETEGKGKFSLDLSFFTNLTKQQKGIILIAAIAVVLVIAIVVTVVLVGANNSGSNDAGSGGNNGGDTSEGGDNGEDDSNTGDDDVDLDAAPTNIYVVTMPTKTSYYVNEPSNYAGLSIGVMEENSSGFKLSYDEYPEEFTITGFDSSAPVAEQVITVEYKGYTTTFTIEIKELEQGVKLVGISVDPLPNKTVYKLGEALSYTGGRIVCEYSDGTTKTLRFKDDGVQIGGFADISAPGEYEITVEYFDNQGGYAKTTFTITMTE